MMQTNNNRGFTLIELLVVIAIIGILSSIVLVSLSGARNKAKRASAISSLHSAMTELQSCWLDNGEVSGTVNVPNGNGSTVICRNGTSPFATVSGHAGLFWPNLSSTGFAYQTPTGSLQAQTLVFTVTQTGFDTITCSVATNSCS